MRFLSFAFRVSLFIPCCLLIYFSISIANADIIYCPAPENVKLEFNTEKKRWEGELQVSPELFSAEPWPELFRGLVYEENQEYGIVAKPLYEETNVPTPDAGKIIIRPLFHQSVIHSSTDPGNLHKSVYSCIYKTDDYPGFYLKYDFPENIRLENYQVPVVLKPATEDWEKKPALPDAHTRMECLAGRETCSFKHPILGISLQTIAIDNAYRAFRLTITFISLKSGLVNSTLISAPGLHYTVIDDGFPSATNRSQILILHSNPRQEVAAQQFNAQGLDSIVTSGCNLDSEDISVCDCSQKSLFSTLTTPGHYVVDTQARLLNKNINALACRIYKLPERSRKSQRVKDEL